MEHNAVTTTTLTARDVDAFLAAELMQLLDVRKGAMHYWYDPVSCGHTAGLGDLQHRQSYHDFVYRTGRRVKKGFLEDDEWMPVPAYTSDASADAEVRAAVLAMFGSDFDKYRAAVQICAAVDVLSISRAAEAEQRPTSVTLSHRACELPGDWALAAYFVMAEHGFGSVLDLEREVRGE